MARKLKQRHHHQVSGCKLIQKRALSDNIKQRLGNVSQSAEHGTAEVERSAAAIRRKSCAY
jgi:hypothetical protein